MSSIIKAAGVAALITTLAVGSASAGFDRGTKVATTGGAVGGIAAGSVVAVHVTGARTVAYLSGKSALSKAGIVAGGALGGALIAVTLFGGWAMLKWAGCTITTGCQNG